MSSENPKTSPFDQQDELHDVALEVEGRRFWVPRQLLASFSPVFKAMLYGDFTEAKKDVIRLPEKKAADIEQLLLVLFPTPEQKDIDLDNIEIILELADEYQIVDLRRRSIKLLIELPLVKQWAQSEQKFLKILTIASKYRLIEATAITVKKCAIGFLLTKLQTVFDDLRPEVVTALVLYNNVIPSDGKCKFNLHSERIYVGYYNCNDHKSEYYLKCVYCGTKECVKCHADKCSQRENSKCKMTRISEPDEIVRKLLNSM